MTPHRKGARPGSKPQFNVPAADRRSAEVPTPTSIPRDTVAMNQKSAAAETRTMRAAPSTQTQMPKAPPRAPQNLAAFRQQFQHPKESIEERYGAVPIIVGVALLSCVAGMILTWWLGW
jgi:hypothetical protein